MRKQFDDWLRIRANHKVNEGPMWNWLSSPFTKMKKNLQQWNNDPRSAHNLPHDVDDAIDILTKDGTITRFMDAVMGSAAVSKFMNPALERAFQNIAVARIYGRGLGRIERDDLAAIWSVISKPTKSGKTIAGTRGITRPLDIIGKVPLKVANQRFDVTGMANGKGTPGAVEYDREEAEKMRHQKAAQATPTTPPTPGGPSPMPPTPSSPPSAGGSTPDAFRKNHYDYVASAINPFLGGATMPPWGKGAKKKALAMLTTAMGGLSGRGSKKTQAYFSWAIGQLNSL